MEAHAKYIAEKERLSVLAKKKADDDRFKESEGYKTLLQASNVGLKIQSAELIAAAELKRREADDERLRVAELKRREAEDERLRVMAESKKKAEDDRLIALAENKRKAKEREIKMFGDKAAAWMKSNQKKVGYRKRISKKVGENRKRISKKQY